MTDAERARATFLKCLALASTQFGLSASAADTVAAATAYFNALTAVGQQCQSHAGDEAAKPDGAATLDGAAKTDGSGRPMPYISHIGVRL